MSEIVFAWSFASGFAAGWLAVGMYFRGFEERKGSRDRRHYMRLGHVFLAAIPVLVVVNGLLSSAVLS